MEPTRIFLVSRHKRNHIECVQLRIHNDTVLIQRHSKEGGTQEGNRVRIFPGNTGDNAESKSRRIEPICFGRIASCQRNVWGEYVSILS